MPGYKWILCLLPAPICAVEQISGLRCHIKRQQASSMKAATDADAGEALTSTHFLSCSLYEKISMLGSV